MSGENGGIIFQWLRFLEKSHKVAISSLHSDIVVNKINEIHDWRVDLVNLTCWLEAIETINLIELTITISHISSQFVWSNPSFIIIRVMNQSPAAQNLNSEAGTSFDAVGKEIEACDNCTSPHKNGFNGYKWRKESKVYWNSDTDTTR